MDFKAYPLEFVPILKERIWGGRKLEKELHKDLPDGWIGESWELSTVKGDVSQIANGEYEGKSLQDLIDSHPVEILGKRIHDQYGKEFPLLFKFIDAREDLSIQVHPNDELARKRHNSFGKTEMWYIMQADAGSRIIAGFNKDSNAAEYLKSVENNTVIDLLGKEPAKAGDVYFLETGTVHAIGAGVLLAEIQQTSDITYRIYDFDRVGPDGKKRELHVDLATDAINYSKSSALLKHEKVSNTANLLASCAYFTTNLIPLDGEYVPEIPDGTFSVFMCTEGEAEIASSAGKTKISKGQTVLLPAVLKPEKLSGKAEVLEIYIS